MSDFPSWRKTPDRMEWRLVLNRSRRNRFYHPRICVCGRDPGVWIASADGTGFQSPDGLRRVAAIYNEMADKWERLMKQHPEVRIETW